MGGSHSHLHAHDHADVETASGPRALLFAFLALVAVATVVGLVALWPEGKGPHAQYAVEGITYPSATVVKVHEPCPVIMADASADATPPPQMPPHCNELDVELASGATVTVQAEPGATRSGLVPGDRVSLAKVPTPDGSAIYSYWGTQRNVPIGVLAAAFVLVVAVVARWRGLLALVGLGVAATIFGFWMVPTLLEGASPIWAALTASSAIMLVVLYLAHGVSVRTSTALAGTLVGLLITAALGVYAVGSARLSGMGGETAEALVANADGLEFQALLVAAIIVAGLGVLNDVTITQSSAVWELRAASPTMTRAQLFASGMRIGRDHIASTIYTIVFVYAGTALGTLLLVALYDRSLVDMLLTEEFAEEAVMTLATSIGLVLAMPATTAIAALTVTGPTYAGRRVAHVESSRTS
ncbi:YibE/F family protein [Nocardioides sp.]|uniref:YibE/F family protein n=1 Tax=Nocardioides sp. TaxID=35761 RepID=UPI002CD0E98E|nr:YibE/F family protein [Nocardioides sp.]HSX66377.1 YibE/F family protein [Nocardioides sp.]